MKLKALLPRPMPPLPAPPPQVVVPQDAAPGRNTPQAVPVVKGAPRITPLGRLRKVSAAHHTGANLGKYLHPSKRR